MSASTTWRAVQRSGVAVAAATVMLAATAAAQAAAPELLGVWPEGPALAVEKAGDLGLVATGRMIRTYDLFELSAPVELGAVTLPGAVLDLEIAGEYVYAAVLGVGVAVVDISQPETPRLVDSPGGLLPEGACSVTLAQNGQYALARAGGHGEGGVVIFAVTSPTELAVMGRIEPTGALNLVRSVALDGEMVYTADDFLRIFELPDDTTPLGSIELGYSLRRSVAVAGQWVLVGDWPNPWSGAQPSLTIIDASQPAQPVQLSRVDLVASAVGLAVDPTTGLVVSAGPDLYLTSIADPSAPTLVGTHESDGWVSDMVLDGELVLEAIGDDGAVVVDIADPTAPAARSTIAAAGAPVDLKWADDLLVVKLAGGDIRLIDASDPGAPVDVSRLVAPAGGAWRHSVATGSVVYASATVSTGPPGEQDHRGLLQAIRFSDPAAPVDLGEVEIDAFDLSITAASDDVLLVLAWCGEQRCLSAVDVSDPSAMTVTDRLVGAYTTDLTPVDGSLVVVPDGTSALEVLDVSDPAALAVVGQLTGEYAKPVVVDEDLVLVAADGTRLELVDLADPGHPAVVSTLRYATDPDLLNVALGPGGIVYLLRYRNDDDLGTVCFLTIVSLDDDRELRLRGGMDVVLGLNQRADAVLPIGAGRVVVTTYDAVPSDDLGPPAIVVDASIPARPVEVGRISTGSAVVQAAARGSLLATGTTVAGISFWDLSGVASRPVQPGSVAAD